MREYFCSFRIFSESSALADPQTFKLWTMASGGTMSIALFVAWLELQLINALSLSVIGEEGTEQVYGTIGGLMGSQPGC